MEDNLKISKVEYLSNHLLDNTQISNLSLVDKANSIQILEMKMTFNVRRHQNIKTGISQQPFIGSHSSFKLKLRCPNYILQILK